MHLLRSDVGYRNLCVLGRTSHLDRGHWRGSTCPGCPLSGTWGGTSMRRPGPRPTVAIALVAALVLAVLVGGSMLPAAGRPAKPEANRFAPSGVVGVDPDAAASAAGRASAQATADAGGGGSGAGAAG